MRCQNCGYENENNAVFCTNCGKSFNNTNNSQMPQQPIQSQQPLQPQPSMQPQASQQPLPSQSLVVEENKKFVSVLRVSIFLFALALCIIIAIVVLRQKGYKEDIYNWLAEVQAEQAYYIMDESHELEFNNKIDSIKSGLDGHSSKKEILSMKSEIEEFINNIKETNISDLNSYIEQLNNSDTSFAVDSDYVEISNYQKQAADLIKNGDYKQALSVLQEWDSYAAVLGKAYDNYKVLVSQYDISDYPKVRLYLDIKDENGNFVDNLDSSAFFVNEGRSLDGKFTRASISNVAKLNENEGISICLAADISGSMDNSINQAKRAMNNFIDTVQFNKGDEVELVEFSETSYLCRSFTSDKSDIVSSINSMSTGGSTRLYDTLISEIERVQSRSNAKCIIGFTDGYDNVSVSSADDVIKSAVNRNIPVFLIGIGSSCDNSTLQRIADSTGGVYENISNITSLESIYNSIYKKEKELYLLEYTISDNNNFEGKSYADIYIRTKEKKGGYIEKFSFDVYDFFSLMYNKFLVAGIDCQTRGERNLLDSGLIVTSKEAYANPDCVAHQSQEAIDSGGVGSSGSSTFEVLVYYDVLDVEKNDNGYTVYGVSNYDIRRERKYSSIKNDKEKEMLNNYYGGMDISSDQKFWIEENISNYEKLTLVKDTDGKWKFNTRVYERKDGGKAVTTNTVYDVTMQ